MRKIARGLASFSGSKTGMALLRGILAGVAIGAAGLAGCAFLASAVDVPYAAIGLMATLCIALSSIGAGFCAARAAREQGMLLGGACGAFLFLLLLLGSLSMAPGLGISAVFKLAVALLGGCLGGVWGVNRRSRPKKRK